MGVNSIGSCCNDINALLNNKKLQQELDSKAVFDINQPGGVVETTSASGVSQADNSNSNSVSSSNESDAVAKFREFMSQSPKERMLNLWLKQHGISKEEFEQMSPKEQQALIRQMEQELKQKMHGGNIPAGSVANIVV